MLAGEGEDSWWADKHNKQIVAEKQLKVAHIYVAYNNRSKGDKRIRGALGAGNVEVVMVVSNMEIHRQKTKNKALSTRANHAQPILRWLSETILGKLRSNGTGAQARNL